MHIMASGAEPLFWDAIVVSLVVEEDKVIVHEGGTASSGTEVFFPGFLYLPSEQ